MKTSRAYFGYRNDDGTLDVERIDVQGSEEPGYGNLRITYGFLPPRLDLRPYSPSGYDCVGRGAAQLALAILADLLDDDAKALKLHGKFESDVITHLPHEHNWTLEATDVRKWLAEHDH